jgi:MFS family permease
MSGTPAGQRVTHDRRSATLTSVLVFTTMVAAIISSLGAPLIPTISDRLHVPLSSAQWSLTVTLLVGAVSAPIMGRLGDGPRRRETLIGGLVAVTLGGVVAALATSLAVLVVGRALQGIGLGLVPLTMAAARDHLPRERVSATIAVLSVCAAAGVGAGYPISGLIADGLGLSAAYWFGGGVSALALVCVISVLPSSSDRPGAPLDLPGSALLTTGLVALLLAIAQGNAWGWGSPAAIGLLIGAVILLAAWVVQELHAAAPLVQLRLLHHPAVLTGDVCAVVLGVAMTMNLSGVTEYVQTPRAAGYGFSASVVVAGLCLLPLSAFSLAASRALPCVTKLVGSRALLSLGSLTVAAASAFFAVFHTSLWQAFVMMGLLGAGLGSTFAAIPGMIVSAVPDSETGSATGFFQVARYIGFSLGSALAASLLASHTAAGQQLPSETGYTVGFWVAVAICAAAATLAWTLPTRGRAPSGREELMDEDDAELGSAGLIGLTREQSL